MADIELGPLKDISEILELKPDLTPEEIALATKLRPQLLAILKPGVRTELEAEYAKKYKEFQTDTVKATQEAYQKAIQDWKEDQEPLTQTEISTLLSQDYLCFEVNFKKRDGTIVSLNLVELPQEVEERFLKILKKRFIPMLKTVQASNFKLSLEGDTMDKLQSIVEAVPDVLNVFAELVAICLDPFNEITTYGTINETWVKKNLSTSRILAIMIGQMEVQRYRDFFLNGFRLSKSLKQAR